MLVAVVVTYRAPREMLDTCVGALRAGGGVDRIVVVDNGGTAVVDDPAVELIQPGSNLGFGGGANLGLRRADGLGAQFIALLNDDVRVEPGWLGPVLAAFDADDIGAVQPVLYVEGSNPPEVNSAGVELDKYGQGHDLTLGVRHQASDLTLVVRHRASDLEIFTGGCVVFRGEFCAATGGFDESLFLYYEDVDLARRGAALGWRYRLATESHVWHRGSATTLAQPGRTRYFQERNRLWNLARHESAADFGRGLWLSIRRLRHPPRAVHARALAAGLARAPCALWARMGARFTQLRK